MSVSTPTASKPNTRTVVVADVKCYMCGSVSGSIESDRQPVPRSVLYRRVGQQNAVPVLDRHQLRCERCRGPVFLDEVEVVTQRIEQYNWLEERPRRGRPPKRLIEERRRAQELLDQQAA